MKSLIPFVLIVGFVFQGCATSGGIKHGAALTIHTAEIALALADETEEALVCGQPTALEGHCISQALHVELSKKFVTGFKFVEQAADLYLTVPEGQPTPVQIGVLATKVALLVQEIIAALPEGSAKASLLKAKQVKAVQEVQ